MYYWQPRIVIHENAQQKTQVKTLFSGKSSLKKLTKLPVIVLNECKHTDNFHYNNTILI